MGLETAHVSNYIVCAPSVIARTCLVIRLNMLSHPALAARKTATTVVTWCESHSDKSKTFFSKLQQQVNVCFSENAPGKQTIKKRKNVETFL